MLGKLGAFGDLLTAKASGPGPTYPRAGPFHLTRRFH
jgi:hypothetical protein